MKHGYIYSKLFQADEKDDGITMEEAVEKSMDALVKGDSSSEAYRRMSNESDWSKGKSMLKRKETMRVLQNRASEYHTRKATMKKSKRIREPNIDTIQEIPDEENSIGLKNEPDKSKHVPVCLLYTSDAADE